MNKEILYSKTFEEWKFCMTKDIDCYKNQTEHNNKSDNPCYIPSDAKNINDIVSFQDMIHMARKYLKTDEAKGVFTKNADPEYLVYLVWNNNTESMFFKC